MKINPTQILSTNRSFKVQGGTRSPNADETPFGKLVSGFAHELNQRKTATEMNKVRIPTRADLGRFRCIAEVCVCTLKRISANRPCISETIDPFYLVHLPVKLTR